MRSIFPESVSLSPSSSPRCSSGAARSLPKRDLEAPRHERRRRLALLLDERCEVAPERLVELALLHLGEIHPHAGERVVEAAAHKAGRGFDMLRLELLDPELGGDAREEPVESLMGDAAALLRVGLGVDRLRIDEALDEPGRGAIGEALELRHPERRARAELVEHERMREPRGTLEGGECAFESPLPAVRASQSVSVGSIARRQLGERAQPFALGRRLFERPRQSRQRTTTSPAAHVVGVEDAPATSCQNGLASRGLPSSSAASRTR